MCLRGVFLKIQGLVQTRILVVCSHFVLNSTRINYNTHNITKGFGRGYDNKYNIITPNCVIV